METTETQAKKRVQYKLSIEPEKTKDLGYGVVEAIVSTPSKDRHQESIKIEGIDLKHYKQNPVVLYGHDYDALPIGKTISIKKQDGKLVAKFQFAINEYAFARTVYELVKGGYLNDVSIGGIVTEWSSDYTTIEKMEMLEFSVVNMGANRDAKIIARSIGKEQDQVEAEYKEFIKEATDHAVRAKEITELNDSVKSLQELVATLTASLQEAQNEQAPAQRRIKLFTLKKTAQEVDKTIERTIKLIKLKETQ